MKEMCEIKMTLDNAWLDHARERERLVTDTWRFLSRAVCVEDDDDWCPIRWAKHRNDIKNTGTQSRGATLERGVFPASSCGALITR